MLVLRDLQKKYTKFRLGYFWSLLEPLGMSLVLWLVFSVLLGERALGLSPLLAFSVGRDLALVVVYQMCQRFHQDFSWFPGWVDFFHSATANLGNENGAFLSH